jgi:hypothetical protein
VVEVVLQSPRFWEAVSALGIALCYWLGLKRWRIATLISDTPASRVRSAAQGYIEITGVASNPKGGANRAPLSGQPCVWWSFKIEEPDANNRRRGWHTVDSGTSDETFLLTDDSGYCVVDPEGAEIFGAERQVWYGGADCPPKMGTSGVAGALLGGLSGGYRYTESRIGERCMLEIVGEFHSLGSLEAGDTEQDTVALLRQWKLDQPGLLKRFDTNHDGVLSEAEWAVARQAAREQVRAEQNRTVTPAAVNLMARPRDGRAFLLAARPLAGLAQKARLQAISAWAGFVACAALLTWLLTQR